MEDGQKIIGVVDGFEIVVFQETEGDFSHRAVWVQDSADGQDVERLALAGWDMGDVDERILDVLARMHVAQATRQAIHKVIEDFITKGEKESDYTSFLEAIKEGWDWRTLSDVEVRFQVSRSTATEWVNRWSRENIR
jgi:hypothetical protein